MFNQSNKPSDGLDPIGQPVAGSRPSSGEPSIISSDLKVIGNLECSGDMQVKGMVEGDIRSRSVTIGEGAHVEGCVFAESVQISGTIKGQIEAPAVSVAKGAKVVGDIVHETLAVEAGAYLEGSCRRLEAKKPAQQASVAPVKRAAKPEAAAGEPSAAPAT